MERTSPTPTRSARSCGPPWGAALPWPGEQVPYEPVPGEPVPGEAMKILVAGSRGLIGRALVQHLTGRGHQVVRLTRRAVGPTPAAPARPPDEVVWDPPGATVDPQALAELGPFDAAVNLAGAGIADRRWSANRRLEILDSRAGTTGLMARTLAALDAKPGVMVSASAVGYYGDRGPEELTEDSPPGTGFLADVCQAWEAAAAPAAGAGIRVVQTRFGIVLSSTGGILGRLVPLFKLGLGARLGTGRQYVSWISLPDAVAVLAATIDDAALSGPVNASAPVPVTNAELTAGLARAVHRPAVLSVPAAALRLGLGHEMADDLLLSSQRVLPAVLVGRGHRFAHPELDVALSALLAGAA
jgi:uncharacterized protein (TIGR01777 family)